MIETIVDGRYQIVARVASGGMGEVFRAHDTVLGRDVALKVLHPQLADDPGFIERFRREARAAAMLSHPNIVAVHDWGQTEGTYFMVMEFVRGTNLRALLMHHGPLLPAQAAEVISHVLAALQHAHEQGIVHRDVKPENILLTSAGVASVADFGLARAFAESRITQTPGTVTGTVQYLAPEQIEGEPADPRTDLYATGIVLYELLAGKVPFTGETSVAIAYKHLRERVPPPSRANPMVPPSLDRVVLSATEQERERRTPDARTMRAELGRAAEELPPAPPIAEIVADVPPVGEEPPDRAATVTIPRALSPRTRRRQFLARVGRIAALAAVVAAVGWAAWTYVIPHRVTVPDFRGRTLPVAQRLAEEAGLELVVAEQVFSSDVDSGKIVSQSEGPGSSVDRGSQVSVVVSRGPQFVVVPGVEGLALARARKALEDAGLEWGVVKELSTTVAIGVVIEQNPRAETTIEAGKEVRLTVSKGTEIPNVVGKDRQEGEDLLAAAGLEVIVREAFSDALPRGDVIRQDPDPGELVDPGTEVLLVVSKGPRTFPMPNVIGMQWEDARALLQSKGLEVKVVILPNNTNDQVVHQVPAPGSTVRAGQEVTIYVA